MAKRRGVSYEKRVEEINRIYDQYAKRGVPNREIDPDEVDLPFLIDLYFKTIDPTSLNKQGGDRGTQYRTGIYYTDTADLPVIRETVDRLAANYSRPLVVEIEPLKNFYLAEDYHQDYLDKNPGGYCHINPTLFDLARKAKMKKEGDGEYLNLEK